MTKIHKCTCGKSKVEGYVKEFAFLAGERYWIECLNCGIQSSYKYNKEESIKDWNRIQEAQNEHKR